MPLQSKVQIQHSTAQTWWAQHTLRHSFYIYDRNIEAVGGTLIQDYPQQWQQTDRHNMRNYKAIT